MGTNPQGSFPPQSGGKCERGIPPFTKTTTESELAAAYQGVTTAPLQGQTRAAGVPIPARSAGGPVTGRSNQAPTTNRPKAPAKRPVTGPPAEGGTRTPTG